MFQFVQVQFVMNARLALTSSCFTIPGDLFGASMGEERGAFHVCLLYNTFILGSVTDGECNSHVVSDVL